MVVSKEPYDFTHRYMGYKPETQAQTIVWWLPVGSGWGVVAKGKGGQIYGDGR